MRVNDVQGNIMTLVRDSKDKKAFNELNHALQSNEMLFTIKSYQGGLSEAIHSNLE